MIGKYNTGEYPKIGDVIRDGNGDEFTVYAFTGAMIYANDPQGRANYNSDPAIYSLERRKGGAVEAPAGTRNVAEIDAALQDTYAEIGALTRTLSDHDEVIVELSTIVNLVEGVTRRWESHDWTDDHRTAEFCIGVILGVLRRALDGIAPGSGGSCGDTSATQSESAGSTVLCGDVVAGRALK